jgi:hypothetical protein
MADPFVLVSSSVVAGGAEPSRLSGQSTQDIAGGSRAASRSTTAELGNDADAPRTAPVRRSGSAGATSADGRVDAVL